MQTSETSAVRDLLASYCVGDGIDIGYGGDPIVPHAICFDLPIPYNKVGNHPQHLHGDARTLPFKGGTLDWVYSSHLIEDFTYDEQVLLLSEWVKVLRNNGLLILCAPDQQKYLADCAAKGTSHLVNMAHKESDYSLATFKTRVLDVIKIAWVHPPVLRIEKEWDAVGTYSWRAVIRKVSA